MKKKASIELSESEVKQIIAEYFGVSNKDDIHFAITEGQMGQEIVTCRVWKEIEFPEKITLGSRPNWWPEGAREIPSDPIYPHDPLKPYVTWSDRTDATYTGSDRTDATYTTASGSTVNTKGENK